MIGFRLSLQPLHWAECYKEKSRFPPDHCYGTVRASDNPDKKLKESDRTVAKSWDLRVYCFFDQLCIELAYILDLFEVPEDFKRSIPRK